MPQPNTKSIPTDKFLTMAANLIHKVLLDVPRTAAKNAYKELSRGQRLLLATVKMEDQSTVRFEVSMDHSEFVGKLNFTVFRNSVALLVSNLGQALNEGGEIQVFTQEDDESAMIFGVTAVIQDGNNANVMVLGSQARDGQAAVVLRLMYIDNEQFGTAA